MNTNHDALREAFNAFLLEQHERHKHQHNHFYVARNEWARRTQSTQYEALAASKPEPQAQAGERTCGACGKSGCVAGECNDLDSLRKPTEQSLSDQLSGAVDCLEAGIFWDDGSIEKLLRLAIEAIAKRDAALLACVEALEAINKECFSHVDGRDLFAQMHPRNTLDIKRRVDARETWFEGDWLTDLWGQIKKSRAAIQQAEEARK